MPVPPAFPKMTSGNGLALPRQKQGKVARDCHARVVGHATDLASRMERAGWECPPVRLATADAITAEHELDSRRYPNSLGPVLVLLALAVVAGVGSHAARTSPIVGYLLSWSTEARGPSERCASGMESISGFRPRPWEDRR